MSESDKGYLVPLASGDYEFLRISDDANGVVLQRVMYDTTKSEFEVLATINLGNNLKQLVNIEVIIKDVINNSPSIVVD